MFLIQVLSNWLIIKKSKTSLSIIVNAPGVLFHKKLQVFNCSKISQLKYAEYCYLNLYIVYRPKGCTEGILHLYLHCYASVNVNMQVTVVNTLFGCAISFWGISYFKDIAFSKLTFNLMFQFKFHHPADTTRVITQLYAPKLVSILASHHTGYFNEHSSSQ